MKNIHILETDKPSRLYEFGGNYHISVFPQENFRSKNLYITCDEEIKEGDWIYDAYIKKIIICVGELFLTKHSDSTITFSEKLDYVLNHHGINKDSNSKKSKLILKKFNIEFPVDYDGNHTDIQLTEWLQFEFGICGIISVDNPLSEIRLKNCKTLVGSATLDGKPIIL